MTVLPKHLVLIGATGLITDSKYPLEGDLVQVISLDVPSRSNTAAGGLTRHSGLAAG